MMTRTNHMRFLLLATMAMSAHNPSHGASAFGEEKGFIGMKNLHHENTKNTKRKKRRERGKK